MYFDFKESLPIALLALVIGLIIGALIIFFIPKLRENRANNKATKIINDAQIKAEHITKNAELDAKQYTFDMRQQCEKEIKERKKEITQQEGLLLQREQVLEQRNNSLGQKENNLEEKNKQLDRQIEDYKKKGLVLQEKIDGIIVELEKVAQMSTQEAKDEIFKRVEEKYQKEIAQYMKNREEQAEAEADEKAKDILASAMFRGAQEVTTERSVNTIALPTDEMKGRIIGREGRNIKSLEQLLGVDIIIDDTPEAITVSCFNPIRREVASRALDILVKDGRIQPGRIEEVVAKCQKEVDEIIHKAGQDAVFKLGLGQMNKELMDYVGRLRYRTS